MRLATISHILYYTILDNTHAENHLHIYRPQKQNKQISSKLHKHWIS